MNQVIYENIPSQENGTALPPLEHGFCLVTYFERINYKKR